jgi:DNA-directed RNA polymerase sigma subunit (sigma70/sigma32)
MTAINKEGAKNNDSEVSKSGSRVNGKQYKQMILSTLSPREEAILRKRFGIGDDKTHTLDELGQELVKGTNASEPLKDEISI